MIRNTVFQILICTLAFSNMAMAQNRYNIEKNKRIKLGVSEHYKYEYDVMSGDSTLVYHVKYHKNGEPIQDYVYDHKGKLKDSAVYSFNSKGLRAKRTRFKDGNIFRVDLYNHDDRGNMIDHFQYDGESTLLTHQKRKYNKKNENVSLHNKLRNGKNYYLAAKYKYTKTGKYLSTKWLRPSGKLYSSSLFTYNSHDNCTLITRDKGEGHQPYVAFKYDERNNMIERNIIPENLSKKYVYDSENAMIEETHHRNDTLIKKIRYFYNKFE